MSERLAGMSTEALLDRLWTKAVGQPAYDRDEWRELERRVRTEHGRSGDGGDHAA